MAFGLQLDERGINKTGQETIHAILIFESSNLVDYSNFGQFR